MNLLIAIDHRFEQTADGCVWSWYFDQNFWKRYLNIFQSVTVMSRLRPVETPSQFSKRSDLTKVSFAAVPFYHGAAAYINNFKNITNSIQQAFHPGDAILIRSGQIGNCLANLLEKSKYPYGVEVIGDPYDVFAPGASTHPLRAFLRWWYPKQIRRMCCNAAAVSYVTEHALQQRYPAGNGAFTTNYSSIELDDHDIAKSARVIKAPASSLLTVGTMDQPYKGHDVLLQALHKIPANIRSDVTLTIVGDGKHFASLKRLCSNLGLNNYVNFTGQLMAGEAVREIMDSSDLFILPSRTEGLPRALIEAMSRALPCIASNVGGIPELLPPEFLVPAGDSSALSKIICTITSDVALLNQMSEQNRIRSHDYRKSTLSERRCEFYSMLKTRTREWNAK